MHEQVRKKRDLSKHNIHIYSFFYLDDQFLVTFLRGSKYDQTMAQQKINLFFTMRSILPEITQV